MEKHLVEFNNVSKKYCRKLKRSLIYGVQDIAKEVFGISKDEHYLRKDEFWALENISFRLKRGESVGLIGHNGAGKTTILKLINNLIKPTNGSIVVRGKIGALIALGTGFNPLLTGRENIKIAGAVLGYSRQDIEERFDEIVEFSEIGSFIDSPIRTYSSGMLVRLGFSVAIHTNPDILLIDEILAVGDLNFAIKCFKKITEFRNNGGSIILVSHAIYSIRSNCDRAIWIENGKLQQEGDVEKVCNAYEVYSAKKVKSQKREVFLDPAIDITQVDYPECISNREKLSIELTIKSKRKINEPIVNISFFNVSNMCVLSNFSNANAHSIEIEEGENLIKITYDKLLLTSGIYTLNFVIAENTINNQLAAILNNYKIEVTDNDDFLRTGIIKLDAQWERN